jgi:hypothetical protein
MDFRPALEPAIAGKRGTAHHFEETGNLMPGCVNEN